jgi:hypothetical protein
MEASLTFTFQNQEALSDSYWVKISQEDYDNDLMSLSDAAEVLDSVFDINPCENSDYLTGGSEPIVLEDYEQALKDAFTNLGYDPSPFDSYKNYNATLYVYRSHLDKNYKLVLSTGTVLQTVIKTKEISQIVRISGKKATLDYAVYGSLSTDAPTSIVEYNGSQVALTDEVEGYYTFTYTTQYNEVSVKVFGKSGEAQECLCTVFFQGVTDQLLISPPKEDTAFISNAGDTSDTEEEEEPEETSVDICYKGIKHLKLCSCGGGGGSQSQQSGRFLIDLSGGTTRIKDFYTEIVEVPCKQGGATTVAGVFTTLLWRMPTIMEYVDCPDEFWEGSTEEYYIENCCTPPPYGVGNFPFSLPKCKSTFRLWLGGVGIEGGADKYKALHNQTVRLIPVGPKERTPQGHIICGTIENRQEVDSKNCCDDPSYEDIEINEDDSAEVIADYSYGIVFWNKGISPYTVSVAGNGFYLDQLYAVKSAVTENQYIRVFTEDACGTCTVTIDDGCSTVSHIIMADSGVWVFDSNTCGLSPPGDVSELDSVSRTSCSSGYHPGRFATNFAQYTKGHLRQKEWPTPCTDSWGALVPGVCPIGCAGYFYDCPCSHNTCIAPCHIGCQTWSGSRQCYKISWCSSPGVVELYKWSC